MAARAERMPDTTGLRNQIIMQKGHRGTGGRDAVVSVRSGGQIVEIAVKKWLFVIEEIRSAINEKTAARSCTLFSKTPKSGTFPSL